MENGVKTRCVAALAGTPSFLKLLLSRKLVCMYAHTLRLLITSSMMWLNMEPYNWLKNFYSFYMAAVASIISRHCRTIKCIVETDLIRINWCCIPVTFTLTVI